MCKRKHKAFDVGQPTVMYAFDGLFQRPCNKWLTLERISSLSLYTQRQDIALHYLDGGFLGQWTQRNDYDLIKDYVQQTYRGRPFGFVGFSDGCSAAFFAARYFRTCVVAHSCLYHGDKEHRFNRAMIVYSERDWLCGHSSVETYAALKERNFNVRLLQQVDTRPWYKRGHTWLSYINPIVCHFVKDYAR